MLKQLTMSEASRRIAEVARVVGAERVDVMRLIEIAGMDPATDFRFENWSGVSFAGISLDVFDFTGARLHGCDFTRARLVGNYRGGAIGSAAIGELPIGGSGARRYARLDQAELGRVIHRPGREPHEPAEMTPIANPREAIDWADYILAWQRPHTTTSDRHLPIGAIFQDAPFAPEMVVVPPGEFMMASPTMRTDLWDWMSSRLLEETSQRKVTISAPFAVGRFMVTVEEWGRAQAHRDWKRYSGRYPRIHWDMGSGAQPVIAISWEDVNGYCTWLSKATGKPYRLLSEAEWEYCCRAGTTNFWWRSEELSDRGDDVPFGWRRSAPVKPFAPNRWGVHHGNVWEWCEDNYDGEPPPDGSAWRGGDGSRRVVRAGWARTSSQPDARAVRSVESKVGFRIARSL